MNGFMTGVRPVRRKIPSREVFIFIPLLVCETLLGILPRYSRLLKESRSGRKSRRSRRSFRRKIPKVAGVQTKRIKLASVISRLKLEFTSYTRCSGDRWREDVIRASSGSISK
ncbi:unnamed protein product [Cuscuta europaea]|uniref:Uncharacterized protein n=1 Tax=Cuscuta europaea TaxID=41803 RepID=A0A9P0VMW4_CUSEU|nr:unnamed protein product [Cuscuta europaea]